MKKLTSVLLISGVLMSGNVHAQSWLDSLKSMLGFDDTASETAAQPNVQELISTLSQNLGVSSEQASGGIAALLNYAQQNVSPETFSALSQQLPGVESALRALPDISNLNQEGIGGLLDKAAQYSDSLKSVNELNKYFEALGLNPEMIMGFVEQARAYLDTEQGQEAKKLLTESLSGIPI